MPDACRECRRERLEELDTHVIDDPSESDHQRKILALKAISVQLNLASAILASVNVVDGCFRVSCDYVANPEHQIAGFALPVTDVLVRAIKLEINRIVDALEAAKRERAS